MPTHAQTDGNAKATPEQSPTRYDAQDVDTASPLSQPAALVQPALRAPGALTPRSVLRLQSSLGNRAVQRIIYHKSTGKYTAGGQPVEMEAPSKPANCHGFTYGTWVTRDREYNPAQSKAGVGVIVEQEAGSQLDAKTLTRDDAMVNPPSFSVKPEPGNLIVVKRGDLIIHSATVAASEGKRFNQVKVANVQGYGGEVEAGKQLHMVSQLTSGATVCLYQKTPATRDAA
jgi:hypothetical protein